tara:strand:+ start:644 stop:1288 length:645 start_codon:yes stop_codon:yes gene_type:complete
MSYKNNEELAYKLINLFTIIIKTLNEGILPLPQKWTERLDDSLEKSQLGRRPSSVVARKHIETKKLMIENDMADSQQAKSKTEFLWELAERRGYSDPNDIYRNTKDYLVKALIELANERSRFREDESISKRVEDIKNFRDMFFAAETDQDLFSNEMTLLKEKIFSTSNSLMPLKSREQAVSEWLEQGECLLRDYSSLLEELDKDFQGYLDSKGS